ncbi:hypothetical protein ACOSQ3_023246 [Xanthoceras sorbifolium]
MVESLKNAAKRALKQRQAIHASITRSRNRGIVIINEDSSYRSVYLNTQNTPNTQVIQESNSETKKKTRGVTHMIKLKVNKPVEDEINQLRESTCPPNDNNINEDSLAKVLGAEKRGRVRSLGFGATPSRVQT